MSPKAAFSQWPGGADHDLTMPKPMPAAQPKPNRQAGRSILFALPGAPTEVGRFETHISCALPGGCFQYFARRLTIGGVKGKSLTVFGIDSDAADRVRRPFLR